jgi:hypothetical protein
MLLVVTYVSSMPSTWVDIGVGVAVEVFGVGVTVEVRLHLSTLMFYT